MLENTQARAQIDLMEKKKAALESEMTSKDQLVAKIQSEITRNNAMIKRKTDHMEQLNAKIDKMVAAAGGVELGPLEIQINSLQKSIEAENIAIVELQQSWLRDQSELVSMWLALIFDNLWLLE
jgi:chromosome segregation ATPase